MEDEKIVKLFWQRDEAAIQETSAKYGAYCHSIALRILDSREKSEECVNDTWLKAWHTIPPQQPMVLRAFLGTITRNLALTALRDACREKRGGGQTLFVISELENCLPDDETPEKALEDKELTRAINQWLGILPKEQRVAFLRRYWYFDDLQTISHRMAWSQSKTNSLLRRLRIKLKEYLKSEGFER